jgi:hypothetical protein
MKSLNFYTFKGTYPNLSYLLRVVYAFIIKHYKINNYKQKINNNMNILSSQINNL